jgi:hypothetical protein
MRFSALIAAIVFFFNTASAQTAGDYFVTTIGTSWHYNKFILDSNQQKINPEQPVLTFDSLIGMAPILSRDRYIFLSNNIAVSESVQYELSNNTIFRLLDNVLTLDTNVIDIGKRFSGWYPIMNFNKNVNSADTVIRFDTTIVIDTLSLPLQFLVTSTKKTNRSVSVPAGLYLTTPFDVKYKINILLAVPFLGILPVPLVDITDTIYLAKGHWIVKEIQQTTKVPAQSAFSALLPQGIPSFNIPGSVRELNTAAVTAVAAQSISYQNYSLEQNYPNPFNPTTTIQYVLPHTQHVKVTVSDILGKELTVLADCVQNGGSYSIDFNASRLPSGVYFYQLQTDMFTETKKMIIQK